MESSPLLDGTPRSIGRSEDGKWFVELIGPDTSMTKVTLLASTSMKTLDLMSFIGAFLGLIVPEWEAIDIVFWLEGAIATVILGGDVRTNYAGLQLTLVAFPDIGLLNLTVEAKPP